MRGKVPNAPMISASARITPACAGKSLDDILYLPQLRDHPRVCGEKWLEVQKTMLEMGSPPRVRGKGEECGEVHFQTGITPACAGKSSSALSLPPPLRDHPRVCGEKEKLQSCDDFLLGSPPRVRGKVVDEYLAILLDRITPACAGKSRGKIPDA